jgi:hypothetical protein
MFKWDNNIKIIINTLYTFLRAKVILQNLKGTNDGIKH